jgi:copper(I)-binding protein
LEAVTCTLRRARLAVVTAFVVATLVGCGTGFDAQTSLVDGPEGTQAEVGDILVRNALFVAASDDNSTGALVVGLVNHGAQADALTEIRVGDGATTTESTLPATGLELPPGELVSIGSTTGPSVLARTEPPVLAPGNFVELTLGFRNAGSIQVSVTVQDRVGPYATVPASPFPTETATPSPTQSPGATGSPSPTPTETPSPTASPTTT